MSKPLAIFLMGPTASGKSALAMELVQRLPCDIISVDSALVYRGMDIGTAKPTAAYAGSGVYQYKRLSLAQVLEFSHEDIVPIDITDLALYPDPWVPPHPTVYDLLPAINAYFGINLTIDDVENTPITRKVDTSPGCYSVFIIAKADSWLWYGNCTFEIRTPFEQQVEETIPDVPLTDVIAITTFNGFNTPKLSGV